MLLLAHPEVSGRSCADCRQWCYQDSAERLSGKKMLLANGQPMPRVVADSMPCRICPKIPRSSVPAGQQPGPHHAVELTPQNLQAYWHYLECKAVGCFPADPIVRRNAALIRLVEDDLDRERGDVMPLFLGLLSRG